MTPLIIWLLCGLAAAVLTTWHQYRADGVVYLSDLITISILSLLFGPIALVLSVIDILVQYKDVPVFKKKE